MQQRTSFSISHPQRIMQATGPQHDGLGAGLEYANLILLAHAPPCGSIRNWRQVQGTGSSNGSSCNKLARWIRGRPQPRHQWRGCRQCCLLLQVVHNHACTSLVPLHAALPPLGGRRNNRRAATCQHITIHDISTSPINNLSAMGHKRQFDT